MSAAASADQTAAIELKALDIVFARTQARRKEALKLIDAGKSRDDIIKETGAILGAAGVNLTIQRGEICVLMGLSGSGKSTVLRAINGLNETSRGAVLVAHDGDVVDVASCGAQRLREIRQQRVAMVFQQFALLPWRTVKENVGFGLELRGVPKAERDAQVDAKLAMVGLSAWRDKYAHELSGGMQQRVGLARAFATDADILLMDEPFSALDPLIRAKLQDELLTLQMNLKKTIVFVSHDLDEALKLGTHIAIMEGGRIVQYGRPEDIVLRPANDYVREFVANVNPLNVLTAYNVMRNVDAQTTDADGWVMLEADPRPTRVRIDADRKAVAADANNREAIWVEVTDAAQPFPEGADVVFWARETASLRHVMRAMQRDAGPVAVFDANDRLTGTIGVRDVLSAVLRREE